MSRGRIITPRLREQAADICAIAASRVPDPDDYGDAGSVAYVAVARLFGEDSHDAIELACDAWDAAGGRWPGTADGRAWPAERDAEAESLLRTGFVPEGWRDA